MEHLIMCKFKIPMDLLLTHSLAKTVKIETRKRQIRLQNTEKQAILGESIAHELELKWSPLSEA